MFTFLLSLLMFMALVLQHFVGIVPGFGSQILLLPIVFLCGAAALPLWDMLILAFAAGLMWDCLNFLPLEGRAEIPFGGTIVLYALMGSVMNGLRPLYLRGWWLLHVFMVGLLTALLVMTEFAILTFRREPFALIWPPEVWVRIGGSGLVAGLFAIPAFLLLNWVGRRAGLFIQKRTAK